MVSLAASGGGSSHPTSSASDRFFGYESMTELFRSAVAFLETIDGAKRKDLLARLKSLVHTDGPLNPKIVGVFFQIVCQESVRNQSYDDYDHLREQLEKLFGLIPEIRSSFGSHIDDSTMLVQVTDIKGESKTLHFPTRMVINSAVMRDFMERRAAGMSIAGASAAGGAGAPKTTWTFQLSSLFTFLETPAAGRAPAAEPVWTFQLPPFCTFELFHDYLSFYQTGALPKESLIKSCDLFKLLESLVDDNASTSIEKSCHLLKLADYLMDNTTCTSIVEILDRKLQKSATLEDLEAIINTLGASIVGEILINASLSHLIQEAIKNNWSGLLFDELTRGELKEALAGLNISLNLDRAYLDKPITDELVKQLTIAFPAMAGLSIQRGTITNAGLAQLTRLTSLTSLNLSGCWRISIDHLVDLTSLTFLNLSGCCITDAGLTYLRALSSLTSLDLSDCSITDVGLAFLETLPCLRYLYLSIGMRTSAAGHARLAAKGVQIIIWVRHYGET